MLFFMADDYIFMYFLVFEKNAKNATTVVFCRRSLINIKEQVNSPPNSGMFYKNKLSKLQKPKLEQLVVPYLQKPR